MDPENPESQAKGGNRNVGNQEAQRQAATYKAAQKHVAKLQAAQKQAAKKNFIQNMMQELTVSPRERESLAQELQAIEARNEEVLRIAQQATATSQAARIQAETGGPQ